MLTDPLTAFLIVWASVSTASIALAVFLWRRQSRRRVSTHLTPKYEARRTAELRAARERFNLIPDGGVRRHQQEGL